MLVIDDDDDDIYFIMMKMMVIMMMMTAKMMFVMMMAMVMMMFMMVMMMVMVMVVVIMMVQLELNTVMLRMVMDGDFLCHNHCSLQRLSRESRVEHNIGASLHTDCKPPGIAWGQRSKKEPDKDLKRKTDPIYPGRLRAPRHSARF